MLAPITSPLRDVTNENGARRPMQGWIGFSKGHLLTALLSRAKGHGYKSPLQPRTCRWSMSPQFILGALHIRKMPPMEASGEMARRCGAK
jgi:hypothetical protein